MSYAKKDFEKGIPFRHKKSRFVYMPMYSDSGMSIDTRDLDGSSHRHYCIVTKLGEQSFTAFTTSIFGTPVEVEIPYTDLTPASL